MDNITYLVDPSIRDAFMALMSPPTPSPTLDVPLQSILTYKTTLKRCAAIWFERQRALRRAIPSRPLWRLFEQEVLGPLGAWTIDRLLETPNNLASQMRAVEEVHGAPKACALYRLLVSIGHFMHAQGLTPFNICTNIYAPSARGLTLFLLSEDQRNLIYHLGQCGSTFVPPAFCLATGITPGELALLDQRDFHDDGSLSVTPRPASRRFGRRIPLSRPALGIIASSASKAKDPSRPLFTTRTGKRFSEAASRKALLEVNSLAGIRDLTYRNIQRDFIIRSLLQGTDPIQLKDYLGLTNPQLILSYWERILGQTR